MPPDARFHRWLLAGVACALGVWTPLGGAEAQGAHGLDSAPPPIHRRLTAAEHAAIGEVRSVESGRIEVVRVRALRGDLPEVFEVKRAPDDPPAVVVGDRALWLLRGARSPYVLSERAAVLDVVGLEQREAWESAIAAFAADAGEPSRWLDHYERWIDAGPESLRRLAVRGLLDGEAPFWPLDPGFVARRRAAALDPGRPLEARTASAFAASLGREAADAMLAALPETSSLAPEVAVIALQAAQRTGSPGLEAAIEALLDAPDPEVRSAAAGFSASLASAGPDLRERLRDAAAGDGDAAVRHAAGRALARLEPD